MTYRYYSNTAVSAKLAAAVVAGNTSLLLDTTSGFPASTPFTLVVDPDTLSAEVVTVTAVAGTTVTVTRGQDGTSAVAHDVGAAVIHAHSARDFKDSRDHEAAAIAHGTTSTLVGINDIQTLTNKNLASGTNTFPSSLVTLTGTQTLTNKTLTSPTLNSPTLTSPSMSNATATGTLTVGGTDITGAWTAYTPTLGNITLNNGTLQARYRQVGKTVDVSITLTVGTTTTTSAGAISFTPPVAALGGAIGNPAAGGAVSQTSPFSAGVPYITAGGVVQVIDGNGGSWQSAQVPAAGNRIWLGFRYEAA